MDVVCLEENMWKQATLESCGLSYSKQIDLVLKWLLCSLQGEYWLQIYC